MLAVRRAVVCAATILCAVAPTASAVVWPDSIAATGDSITLAFNTGCGSWTCPERSWATGTQAEVRSIYYRIWENNRAIEGRAVNNAVTGSKVSALEGQMAVSARSQPDVVTIEIGANDACTETTAEMTSVAAFEAEVEASLGYITERVVGVRMVIASIPDVYNLWRLFRGNILARTVWNEYRICQSLLRDPLSVLPADEARRLLVRQRVVEYNAALSRACAVHLRTCQYDGGAVFNYSFVGGEIAWDFFHPGTTGQAAIARAVWEAIEF